MKFTFVECQLGGGGGGVVLGEVTSVMSAFEEEVIFQVKRLYQQTILLSTDCRGFVEQCVS